jgi:hypothetical protein
MGTLKMAPNALQAYPLPRPLKWLVAWPNSGKAATLIDRIRSLAVSTDAEYLRYDLGRYNKILWRAGAPYQQQRTEEYRHDPVYVFATRPTQAEQR